MNELSPYQEAWNKRQMLRNSRDNIVSKHERNEQVYLNALQSNRNEQHANDQSLMEMERDFVFACMDDGVTDYDAIHMAGTSEGFRWTFISISDAMYEWNARGSEPEFRPAWDIDDLDEPVTRTPDWADAVIPLGGSGPITVNRSILDGILQLNTNDRYQRNLARKIWTAYHDGRLIVDPMIGGFSVACMHLSNWAARLNVLFGPYQPEDVEDDEPSWGD